MRQFIFPVVVLRAELRLYCSFLRECDGIVQATDPICDPGAKVMEQWMASFSPPRRVYNIGPQLPLGPVKAAVDGEFALSPNAKEIVEFLCSTLQSHGPNSVVYVS
jgi:hypothetical protein